MYALTGAGPSPLAICGLPPDKSTTLLDFFATLIPPPTTHYSSLRSRPGADDLFLENTLILPSCLSRSHRGTEKEWTESLLLRLCAFAPL